MNPMSGTEDIPSGFGRRSSVAECRHAPPSKRVVLDERHHTPVALVQAIVKRWDRDTALVLADWLEHQGFPGFAQKLRRKSFSTYDMQRSVAEISGAMGVNSPQLMWSDNWKRKKAVPRHGKDGGSRG